MWADIKGELQDYEKKRLTLHCIQEVDMFRKCRQVCLLIQYKMVWLGDD